MQSEPMGLFVEAWEQMTGTLPTPHHENADGITSCFCDVPNLFFNLWFQVKPTRNEYEFRKLLKAGKKRMESWHQPVGGILRDDWLPDDWEAIMADEGMTVMMPMLGMEATSIIPSERAAADLEIRRVSDDATAYDAAMVNAHAYDMDEELFAPCGGMHFWPEGSLAYVGYVDGKPVATAAARTVNGTVYIALVATEPAEQGKGYAATIMRHAIEEGRKAIGSDCMTLHATMAGAPTYGKMGFAKGPGTPLIVPAADPH